MRLKANVISDTQQEPSDHPSGYSITVMEKKKERKRPGPEFHSSDSLSIRRPQRQMLMIEMLWWPPNGIDNEVRMRKLNVAGRG